MSRDYLNRLTEESIRSIFGRPISDKDKLFLIRRNIALQYKEMAYGEDFEFPFRFEICIASRGGRLLIDYVQFSLPFINLLEQINEEF